MNLNDIGAAISPAVPELEAERVAVGYQSYGINTMVHAYQSALQYLNEIEEKVLKPEQ